MNILNELLKNLPKRKRDANKGDFGHVLIVGGALGMLGSVILASKAASCTGAGLVTVATYPDHATVVSLAQPNVMSYGIKNLETLLPLLEHATVVVIGPGLSQNEWAHNFFSYVLELSLPLIVDADGLNLLAENPIRKDNWVLTPHPGEAARLLKISTKEVQLDRAATVHALQEKYGGVIVLKGSGTLVFDNQHKIFISNAGNPGMATGGMGDLLSGIIGGLVSQHLSLFDAAVLGIELHANAGDEAAQQYGERGLQPQQLLSFIQKLINI